LGVKEKKKEASRACRGAKERQAAGVEAKKKGKGRPASPPTDGRRLRKDFDNRRRRRGGKTSKNRLVFIEE